MKMALQQKILICGAVTVVIAVLGVTGNRLTTQNKALSEQISELSKQVQDLQQASKTLQAQVDNVEKQLEPRVEPLLGYNR